MAIAAGLYLPVATGACHRVELFAPDGTPVVGAEDLAVDRRAGRLFISAHDRRAVDAAIDAGAEALPRGAIYSAALARVAARPDRLRLRRVAGGAGRVLRPHGIALAHADGANRLLVVHHGYQRSDGDWRRRSRVEVFAVRGADLVHRRSIARPGLCRANDLVALGGDRALVARDHGACSGVGLWLETVLGLDQADVVLVSGIGGGRVALRRVIDGLAFANGIARSPGGGAIAVAASRGQRVRIYPLGELLGSGEASPRRVVAVGGAPDNLSWPTPDRLLAAVHPSILDIGMARHGWFGVERSGSRLVAIDPDTGRKRTLFEDRDGHRFSAASSVVEFGDTIVAGTLLDRALLVCPRTSARRSLRLNRGPG